MQIPNQLLIVHCRRLNFKRTSVSTLMYLVWRGALVDCGAYIEHLSTTVKSPFGGARFQMHLNTMFLSFQCLNVVAITIGSLICNTNIQILNIIN